MIGSLESYKITERLSEHVEGPSLSLELSILQTEWASLLFSGLILSCLSDVDLGSLKVRGRAMAGI